MELSMLPVKQVTSLLASKSDLGCLLDGDRYYYYYMLKKNAYWVCWDFLKKREVLIKQIKNGKGKHKKNFKSGHNKKLTYGCLLMERYYVMNKVINGEYLTCWDLLKKRDIAINYNQQIAEISKTSWLPDENKQDSPDLSLKDEIENDELDFSDKDKIEYDKPDLSSKDEIENDELDLSEMGINCRNSSCIPSKYNGERKNQVVHPVACGYEILGRYRVLEWVSDASNAQFSNVCLCLDVQEQRYVAIKIFKPMQGFVTLASGEMDMLREIQERFPTDARRERIIKILENFKITNEQGLPMICIVFEAMEGDLYKLTKGGRGLSVDHVKNIMRQLLEGLEFLHENFQIIHADLKLENILFSQKQIENTVQIDIKIADFGNSCWSDEPLGHPIQTEPYRAVEVVLKDDYDVSADIWSTACIGYELATGMELFSISSDILMHEKLHLADMMALLGPIPQQVLARGAHTERFFSSEGQLLHDVGPLQSTSLVDLLQQNSNWSATDVVNFAAFLTPMLEYDANKRATAVECLQHDWLA